MLCEIKRNMMKYLEQYLKEKMKIKVLGNLSTRESNLGEEVGEVRYVDYSEWLEEKIKNKYDGKNEI